MLSVRAALLLTVFTLAPAGLAGCTHPHLMHRPTFVARSYVPTIASQRPQVPDGIAALPAAFATYELIRPIGIPARSLDDDATADATEALTDEASGEDSDEESLDGVLIGSGTLDELFDCQGS